MKEKKNGELEDWRLIDCELGSCLVEGRVKLGNQVGNNPAKMQ